MNWPLVPLGRVVKLEYGKALRAADRDPSGRNPVAGSNGPDGMHSKALVTGPGIVVGRKGSAGKVVWYQSDFWPIDTTYYVRPMLPLDMRWVFHLLKNLRLERLAATGGVPGLNRNDAYRVEIPLPPPSEQRRIVEILDQADALRRVRAEADAKAERILPALFLKMFGDPAGNPKGWEMATIGSIAERMSDGPFGSNLKTSHYVAEGVRVVRLQNIGVGRFIDDDRAFVSREHFATLSKHRCVPGDVLVGTLGDPNLRACQLPESLPEALNKADCVQFRARSDRATNEYVCWLLNMPSTLLLAGSLVHGQTRTRVSMGRLRDLEVPVPTLDLQKQFGECVRSWEQMDSTRARRKHDLGRLFQVLSQKAFAGTLTDAWREAHRTELAAEIDAQSRLLSQLGSNSEPDGEQG